MSDEKRSSCGCSLPRRKHFLDGPTCALLARAGRKWEMLSEADLSARKKKLLPFIRYIVPKGGRDLSESGDDNSETFVL